jgi:FkbM family methyltransferase
VSKETAQEEAAGAITPNSAAANYQEFHPAFSPGSCYLLQDEAEAAAFVARDGAPEAKLIDWATSLVGAGQSFIDVGAHVGTWAQHFAQKCRSVHAFEPQHSTFARLREGAKLAGLTNITCHEVALGSLRGEVDLHIVSSDGGGSTLRPRPELPPAFRVERVKAAQLDDYAFEDVGLIKIDVEGFEIEVLRGATKLLKEHRPHLLLEAWGYDWYDCDRAELIAYVEQIGYRVRPVAGWPEMLHAEPVSSMVEVDLKGLFAEVEVALPEGGDWCSQEKALGLVTLIVGLRPKVVVELGVWMGGSAIPMAIALRHLGFGKLVAVDSWSPEASVAGMEEANAHWWGETIGVAGHETAFQVFVSRLKKHKIGARCVVRRERADQAAVPAAIDLLHHDANHGPQAFEDIERWAPAVRVGGFLVLDDVEWSGGHVGRAKARAIELGFVERYPLGTGCVMQRVRS